MSQTREVKIPYQWDKLACKYNVSGGSGLGLSALIKRRWLVGWSNMGHLVVSTQQKNTQIMLLKKTCHVMSKSDRQMQRLKVLEAIVAIICQYKLFDSNGWNTLLVALWLSISYQTPNHWIDIIDKDFFVLKQAISVFSASRKKCPASHLQRQPRSFDRTGPGWDISHDIPGCPGSRSWDYLRTACWPPRIWMSWIFHDLTWGFK